MSQKTQEVDVLQTYVMLTPAASHQPMPPRQEVDLATGRLSFRVIKVHFCSTGTLKQPDQVSHVSDDL